MSREEKLEASLKAVLAWTSSGACADCTMFRESPAHLEWLHHKDCAHLTVINYARKLLGMQEEGFHEFDDPESEMIRLAEERARCVKNSR